MDIDIKQRLTSGSVLFRHLISFLSSVANRHFLRKKLLLVN